MTQKQFRVIILLFAFLLIGQQIQTFLLLRAQRLTQKTAESAEVAAIDALEVAKQAKADSSEQDSQPAASTHLLVSRP